MENKATLLVLLLVLCHGMPMAMSFFEDEDWSREGEERPASPDDWFLMQHSKRIVKTDAGEMRVLKSYGGRILERPMHIGFISMEPRSLFIPQYLDSSLILFVHIGEAKVGYIYKNELAERKLKSGDVYRIPAGSAFYLVNTQNDQRLHIICSIDPSESLGVGVFQSFYIGGGIYPASVLSGFDPEILEAALNASTAELRRIFTRQNEGPIVFVGDSRAPSLWTKFLQLKEQDRLQNLKRMVEDREEAADEEEEEEEETSGSWRKLLQSVFGTENRMTGEKGNAKSPDTYNLYDRKPDFRNSYGWSVALDGYEYSPLKSSGVGVYLVNLTAGSMMAPHVNPRATEYGVVLRGSGRIQIVYPNGSSAMNKEVKEGNVFFVPRYFPFCQIAAMDEDLEFFGFTTSAERNRPEFLAGATSLLRNMMGPELAASFGVSEETLKRVAHAQRESIILPAGRAAPVGQNQKLDLEEKVMMMDAGF